MAKKRTRTRVSSKIDELPEALRVKVDVMLADTSNTYEYISQYLKQEGYEISKSSVGRYAMRSNTVDCQHFFRQIFLGYFSDIVQAFDTLRKNVCGDDYTSLHNPIVLSSVLPAYGMFHSIQILFL